MSLIRLLTTTRSLSDVKNEPSPYRMTEQGLLPKFGPREKAGGDARPANERGEQKENLGEGTGDRMDAGCSLKLEGSRKLKRLADWWRKVFRQKSRREAVQAEFALDLVRVVRNELREAENIRMQEQKKNKPKLELQPAEESVFGASRG